MGEITYDRNADGILAGVVGRYSKIIRCHCGTETNLVFRRSDHVDVVACSQQCAEEVERKTLDIQKTTHGTTSRFRVQ